MNNINVNDIMELGKNAQDGYNENLDHMESLNDSQEFADLNTKDGIVTFSKELLLIKMVAQEQMLYNSGHEQYRNAQRKEVIWQKISERLNWQEAQSKNKWKAMRDQYCRELKRLRYSSKATVKWKYFKDLEFLRPFALNRNYRPRLNQVRNTKQTKIEANLVTHNASGIDTCLNNVLNSAINIKIEATPLGNCDFSHTDIDNDQQTRLINSLNNEQLNNVTWSNYLNDNTGVTAATQTTNQGPDQSMLSHVHHQSNNSSEYIYNSFVNCINTNAVQEQIHQQHDQEHQEEQLSLSSVQSSSLPTTTVVLTSSEAQVSDVINGNDEDDLNIFINTESFFEKKLISYVKQEAILYNIYHANYRNLKHKIDVWREISKKLKKTEKQCRQKWKALRDQFIREHKRLKDKEDAAFIPRWKHYDALSFLKTFIKHKSDLEPYQVHQTLKTSELEAGIEDQLNNDSSMDEMNPNDNTNVALIPLHGLPALTRPHNMPPLTTPPPLVKSSHSLHEAINGSPIHMAATTTTGSTTNLCVANNFDGLGIDTYIINENPLNGNVEDDQRNPVTNDGSENNNNSNDEHQQQSDSYQNNLEDDVNSLSVLQSHPNHSNDVIYNLADEQDFNEIKIIHSNSSNGKPCLNSNSSTSFNTSASNAVKMNLHNDPLEFLDSKNNVFASCTAGEISSSLSSLSAKEKMISSLTQKNQTQIQKLQTTQTQTHQLNENTLISSSSLSSDISLPSGTNEVRKSLPIPIANQQNQESSVSPQHSSSSHTLNSFSESDDEVGAFFKAIAMKIRNAKMTPNNFTNLQINILRLINDSLTNCSF